MYVLSMYRCKTCEYGSPIKLWKCPSCGSFWSFEEVVGSGGSKAQQKHHIKEWKKLTYDAWSVEQVIFAVKEPEFVRVLGQWIVKGWLYLIGWEPWIGKSTLIAQLCLMLSETSISYFSWEEHVGQITQRIKRINNNQIANHLTIFHATHLEDIITTVKNISSDIVIIDSIQTIYSYHNESPAWTPSQVKYCAEKLSEFCKETQTTLIIIGHVTKWGEIAWPKYLEHIVDVVMYIEGERFWSFRMLKCFKNRFWHTDDSGIFEMHETWLKPVYDLNQRVLKHFSGEWSWSVLTIAIDNGRPVLVHLEVLLNHTKWKFPQRIAVGIETQRIHLICAILERYCKINLWEFDLFVNVPWEMSFQDSWLDCAIAAWILSQYKKIWLTKGVIFVWELWLGWQILPSKFHLKRSKERPSWFTLVDHSVIDHVTQLLQYIK